MFMMNLIANREEAAAGVSAQPHRAAGAARKGD